ncbi:MAG: zinc-binding alcohol dehydrogenase family protein [Planctomycetota bacterium]|nr:MAG: zinc-binding alcohol dehydrogenase family protein [Planctomycetota bacterium]
MRAMLLEQPGQDLKPVERADPEPGPGQVRLRIEACGVCRTDLHLFDGDLPQARYPLIPGHEIVGRIDAIGSEVSGLRQGQRIGVPWLGHCCGQCTFCLGGQENLCPEAAFTGCQLPGGYAEATLVEAAFAIPLPEQKDAASLAPLLCAGLIGFRAYRFAGEARRLGLFGFGAAAHLLTQLAVQQGREVFAFTRPGDEKGQAFAYSLGATWAGGSDQAPPSPLDAALLFAPVGALVPAALEAVRPGGQVICAGIHMSEIPAFPYRLLWQERSLRSVANLTREDGRAFLAAVEAHPIESRVHPYPLHEANQAWQDLRQGRLHGAAVLIP